jgi:hypothetical protein
VKVAVSIRWAVVIYNDIDPLDVDTTSENVSGDEDTLLERLERSIPADTIRQVNKCVITATRYIPLLLCKPGMNTDTREVARNQKLVQLVRPSYRLYKNDNLSPGYFRDLGTKLNSTHLVEL